MKRWIAMILALTMLFTMGAIPVSSAAEQTPAAEESVYVYTEADNALIEADVFAAIESVKTEAAKTCGGVGNMTEQDYIALIPQVIEAVEASSTYVSGTLQQNGYFLVWQTSVGIPCCYDPRMEAELHNTQNDPTPEEIALAEARADALYQELSELQGGWPSSIKIGLIQPYWDSPSNYADSSFNNYSPSYKAAWEAFYNATGGEGMRYTMGNANVNNIGSVMSQCGLVMFDSHGNTDYSGSGGDYVSHANTSYLCLTTNTGVTSQDTQAQQGQYGTYYHCLSGYGYAYVDGTCISNHMTGDAPNSYLYMGICLGMATDGMEGALRAHGVEAVWGYSQSVSFYGDELYMKSLMGYIKDGDELQEAASKTKAQYGNWDPAYSNYSYSQAVANYVAFPIVASDEDPYPGHGNVDVVQTVYSTWTLYPQFMITALSNNDEWGTVSVSGRKITATPATGYEIVGYDVVSGTATVTRSGNVFQVDAETDCTIQINFAARVPASVTFSVPEGVSCDNFAGYVGDILTMPTPSGTPVGNAHNYAFLGWAQAEVVDDVTTVPAFQKAGTELTVSVPDATYYALYTYFIADDGFTEGEFTLVTSAPANWAGDYVITYQGEKVLDAAGEPQGSIETAVTDLSQLGAVLSGNTLSNVPDDYIYTVEETGNGAYNLKMKEHDVWLALTSDSNSLMTAQQTVDSTTEWILSCTAEGVQIASAAYPNRTLRCNPKAGANGAFRCYKSGQKQISVYAAAQGTKWYTTEPKARVECDVHTFTDWNTVTQPTCTNPGLQKRVCTVCGYSETEALDPLGHDYAAVVTEPNCTEGGYTTHTCTRCGDAYTDEETDPLGHDWNVVTVAPTCTDAGSETKTCTRCGEIETTEIPALGHDWTVETVAPTCTDAGSETKSCSRCGEIETAEIPALGHDWTMETVAPTCTDAGSETKTCARCGETETAEIPALGHDWTVETVAPTCTDAGSETKTCARCSETESTEIPALGHDWTVETVAPTCTNAGSETKTCGRCGEIETTELPALGHDWDDGVFTVQPSAEADGVKVFTCARCGETREETVLFRFDDVQNESEFFFEPVYWALRHDPQITQGISETMFGPKATCTRAQVVTFLWRAAGEPEPTAGANPFADVKESDYFYKAVLWALEKGITDGVSDTSFAPNQTCTRGQVVTFLWRAAGEPKPVSDSNPFSDIAPDAYYYTAVLWALEKGITDGVTDTTFVPDQTCTRGQVVTFLFRAEHKK